MSKTPSIPQRDEVELVTRSDVPPGLPYNNYKQYLRYDFFHSCAYCTMSEAEASAIRFTIDHYEPQVARPDLENTYSNLMYACDQCNMRKGPRIVPQIARANGIRFFRPDTDKFRDHFIRAGLNLKGLSKLADYTIDAVDLNRFALRRLRELRMRLTNCEELISAGIRALNGFKIDRLPPAIRSGALKAISQINETQASAALALDDILREHAKSPLLDEDPEAEALKRERLKRLKDTESLYPKTVWRASKE